MRLPIAALLLLGISSAPLAAQEQQLHPEQRVRIQAPEAGIARRAVGTLMAIRPDSVTVQFPGSQRSIPVGAISSLEVSQGSARGPRSILGGAVVGLLAGAALTWVDRSLWDEWEWRGEGVCEDGVCRTELRAVEKDYSMRRAAALTLGGTGAGVLIGTFLPGDRWKPVSMQVLMHPGGSGIAVQLATPGGT